MSGVYVLELWTTPDDGRPVGVFSTLEQAMEASGIPADGWTAPNSLDSYWIAHELRPSRVRGLTASNAWLIFGFGMDEAIKL